MQCFLPLFYSLRVEVMLQPGPEGYLAEKSYIEVRDLYFF